MCGPVEAISSRWAVRSSASPMLSFSRRRQAGRMADLAPESFTPDFSVMKKS